MRPLSPETVIAVASGVKAELRQDDVWVCLGGATLNAGPYGLRTLDLFRDPQSMSQAMAEVLKRDPDPKVWMFVSAMILQLWQAGILCDAFGTPSVPSLEPAGSSGIHTQARMLNDRTRTHGFLRAIRETVKPNDVVLDLGTGTGVLAIAAAQCGARHVYAIEMTGLADVAEAMFAANGFGDRITLLRGKSTQLELPKQVKADVLVTEIIGDGPLGEGVLESVADARKRLLAPHARIIPAALSIGVVPLRMPDDLLDRYTFSANNVERWKKDYKVDFAATQNAIDPNALSCYRLRTAEYVRCEPLAKPQVLTRIDLAEFADQSEKISMSIEMEKHGPVHAVAMYFDLEISAQERLSTAPTGSRPASISADNHWRILSWVRPQPVQMAAGESLSLTFLYSGKTANLSWRPT